MREIELLDFHRFHSNVDRGDAVVRQIKPNQLRGSGQQFIQACVKVIFFDS